MSAEKTNTGSKITLVMIAIIIVLIIGITIGTVRNNIARDKVLEECPQTEFVVVGRNGTPQYVYDCTGIDLKDKKD